MRHSPFVRVASAPPNIPSQVERARVPAGIAAAFALRYYTSHFFRGGQHCDETGRGRATEVQFFCCPAALESAGGGGGDAPPPTIAGMDEPAVCKYTMQVCVPALCAVPPSLAAEAAVGGAAAADEEQHNAAAAAADVQPTADAAPALAADDASHDAALSDGAGPAPTPTATSDLPDAFFGLLWSALLGDESEAMSAVAGGEAATGIAPVRFA